MKIARLLIVALLVPISLLSQNDTISSKYELKKFGYGFGVGMGAFYPQDVNSYLMDKYNTYPYTGSTNVDMYLNMQASLNMMYRPTNLFSFNLALEGCMSSKTVESNMGASDSYYFYRFSSGLEVFINLKTSLNGVYYLIGVGGLFHHLSFENVNGETFGLRVIPIGFVMHSGSAEVQFHIGADLFSKYTNEQPNNQFIYPQKPNSLDYNGAFLHCIVLF